VGAQQRVQRVAGLVLVVEVVDVIERDDEHRVVVDQPVGQLAEEFLEGDAGGGWFVVEDALEELGEDRISRCVDLTVDADDLDSRLAAEFAEQLLDGGGLPGAGRAADHRVQRPRAAHGGAKCVFQALDLAFAVPERLGEIVDLEDVFVTEHGLVPREHLVGLVSHLGV
jgi:hypothetical protein